MARRRDGPAAPGHRALYGIVAHCFVALAEAERGREAEAAAAARRCAALTADSGAPFYQALARWALGAAHLAGGELETARAELRRAHAECDGADIRSIRPWIAPISGSPSSSRETPRARPRCSGAPSRRRSR